MLFVRSASIVVIENDAVQATKTQEKKLRVYSLVVMGRPRGGTKDRSHESEDSYAIHCIDIQ